MPGSGLSAAVAVGGGFLRDAFFPAAGFWAAAPRGRLSRSRGRRFHHWSGHRGRERGCNGDVALLRFEHRLGLGQGLGPTRVRRPATAGRDGGLLVGESGRQGLVGTAVGRDGLADIVVPPQRIGAGLRVRALCLADLIEAVDPIGRDLDRQRIEGAIALAHADDSRQLRLLAIGRRRGRVGIDRHHRRCVFGTGETGRAGKIRVACRLVARHGAGGVELVGQKSSPVGIVGHSIRGLPFEPLQVVFEDLDAAGERQASHLVGVVGPDRAVTAEIFHRVAIVLQFQPQPAQRDLGPGGVDRAA